LVKNRSADRHLTDTVFGRPPSLGLSTQRRQNVCRTNGFRPKSAKPKMKRREFLAKKKRKMYSPSLSNWRPRLSVERHLTCRRLTEAQLFLLVAASTKHQVGQVSVGRMAFRPEDGAPPHIIYLLCLVLVSVYHHY